MNAHTHDLFAPTSPAPLERDGFTAAPGDLALLTIRQGNSMLTGGGIRFRNALCMVTRCHEGLAVDFSGNGMLPRQGSRATKPPRPVEYVEIISAALFAPADGWAIVREARDLADRDPIMALVRGYLPAPAPAKGRAKGRKAPPAPTPPETAPLAPCPLPGRALAVLPAALPEPGRDLAIIGQPDDAGRALAVLPAAWPPARYVAPWGAAAVPASHLLPSARSLAAYKAAANRDCFAAGRKAADTRAARKLLTAGPPSFVDYVSDRIGTRRWIVGPVKPRDRDRIAKLADKIVTPAWYDALRAAYIAAHGA